MPNVNIQNAVMAMVDAIQNGARERAAYLADPHERQADRDDWLKMIDKRRDDTVKAAKVALSTEFDRIATGYQRARKSSYDEAAVNAAWSDRVKPLLDTFRDVEYIAALPGFDRNQAEAIRRNLPAYEATRFPEAGPSAIDRMTRPALYTVLRSEIALMDRDEAAATEAEFERLAVADVVKSVDKMAVTAAQSGKVSGQSMLEVAYTTAAAGIETPDRSWKSIVDELDPGWRSKVGAPSLSESAENVGFRPAPSGADVGVVTS